ncbi:MAG: cytosine permease [Candidatus Dormiibacterota bacterium]
MSKAVKNPAEALPLPASANDEFLRVELRGLEPVPDETRRGHPRELFFIWAAALADFFSFLAGALLINLGLGVWDAILVLVLGAVAGGILIGPLSVTGVRTGVPQIMYSRIAFGRRGAAIGGLLTMVIAVGWFSYDCAIAVYTAKALPVFGAGPPSWVVGLMVVAMVLGCILVAFFGHRTITIVQTVQAPLFITLCAVVAVVLAPKFNVGLASALDPATHLSVALLGFTATFALIISWATYAGDYSRYLPRKTSAIAVSIWAGAGGVVTLVICGALGALVQTIDPTQQNPALLIVPNLPTALAWVFVAFIVIAEMSSNYLNIYTAALSGLAIGIPLKRWWAVAIFGMVGGAIALVIVFLGDFLKIYLNFLTVTYVWFPAWCIVVLVDFWRRRGTLNVDEITSRPASWRDSIRWPALTAFAVGTAATLLFYSNQPFFQGWLARAFFHDQPADVSSVVGVITSLVLFVVLLRLSRSQRPAAAQ